MQRTFFGVVVGTVVAFSIGVHGQVVQVVPAAASVSVRNDSGGCTG
jgi:hypothetical protein